ncbi:MAG: hypothetical protein GC136_05715 [Alphaproteobacteria bacterium]|nr:hypothetical protein [Alphaproteobacteria bacterium]
MDCPTETQLTTLFSAAIERPAPAGNNGVVHGQDLQIVDAPECGEGVVRVIFRTSADGLQDAAMQRIGVNTFQINFTGTREEGGLSSVSYAPAPTLWMPNGLRSGPFEAGIPNLLSGMVRLEMYVPEEFADDVRASGAVTVRYTRLGR